MRVAAATKHMYHYVQVAVYSGFGGPAQADYSDPDYPATPTRQGRFTIVSIGTHATSKTGVGTRLWSAVPWGTPLRLDRQGSVQIKLLGKDWQRLTSLPAWRYLDYDQASVAKAIEDRNLQLWVPVLGAYTKVHQPAPVQLYRKIPDQWIFNDFGHVTVKYYRDVNHNGRQDPTAAELTLSDFIHTTPNHELFERLNQQASAGLSCALAVSHGCVHTFPAEVDAMIQAGYLRVGGPFVVHSYTARPAVIFDETSSELRTGLYEVHFFPREHKLVVYMVSRLS